MNRFEWVYSRIWPCPSWIRMIISAELTRRALPWSLPALVMPASVKTFTDVNGWRLIKLTGIILWSKFPPWETRSWHWLWPATRGQSQYHNKLKHQGQGLTSLKLNGNVFKFLYILDIMALQVQPLLPNTVVFVFVRQSMKLVWWLVLEACLSICIKSIWSVNIT